MVTEKLEIDKGLTQNFDVKLTNGRTERANGRNDKNYIPPDILRMSGYNNDAYFLDFCGAKLPFDFF